MKTNIQVKTENKYNIKVIRDGEVREEYNFGNTLCKGIMENIASSFFHEKIYIKLGKGTGTPSWDDTGLFSQLWSLEVYLTRSTENKANKTHTATWQVTIPATSSYVGDVTEIGLYSFYYSEMYTHALITDAEGNPITIHKTDLDSLIVTVDFVTTVNSVDGSASTETEGEGIALKTFNVIASHHYNQYALRFYKGGYEGTALTTIESNSKGTTTDTTAKTYTSKAYAKRLAVGDLYATYIKTAAITPDCAWDMKDIFTPYTVQGAAIGTGDGAKTVFACPLSYFKEGTEKIYKNGALLTRGVDYTLDNINNTGAALFLHNDIHTDTTGGEPENASPSNSETYVEFFSLNSIVAKSTGTKLPSTYALSKSNPIYLDFGAPRKCNLLHLFYARVNSGPVTLSYSTDGAAYTPVAEITDLQWTAQQELEQTFTPITARYWRLSTSGDNILYQSSGSIYSDLIPLSYLINKTDGITFTQAPANGDVLTMDATLDYPFKNDKHVIDINWQYTVTIV